MRIVKNLHGDFFGARSKFETRLSFVPHNKYAARSVATIARANCPVVPLHFVTTHISTCIYLLVNVFNGNKWAHRLHCVACVLLQFLVFIATTYYFMFDIFFCCFFVLARHAITLVWHILCGTKV